MSMHADRYLVSHGFYMFCVAFLWSGFAAKRWHPLHDTWFLADVLNVFDGVTTPVIPPRTIPGTLFTVALLSTIFCL